MCGGDEIPCGLQSIADDEAAGAARVKAETREVAKIFGQDVRYVVPLYQRPYVWNAEQHWGPLWDDVRWTFDHEFGGSKDVAPHFLGAIVVEQQATGVGQIDVRLVIDGQQRLTTLQLLIGAMAFVATERGQEHHAAALRKLTENDPYFAKQPHETFKVWPTNVNRDAYRLVMTSNGEHALADDDESNRVQEAFAYFVNAVDKWANDAGSPDELERRFGVLTGVVRQLVKLVVIDLEPEDNAQVIFESLNARGTPLLAIDLVKNILFQRVASSDEEAELLYDQHWKPFDSLFWQQRVKQGRLQRARSEFFLMHWLSTERGMESKADQLYLDFRSLLDGKAEGMPVRPPLAILEELARDRDIFASFSSKPAGTFEARFFRRLGELDTTTVYPLALELYRTDVDPVVRTACLRILESWLARRAVTRLTAAAYNRLFLDLLNDIRKSDLSADQVLLKQLAGAFDADSSRWPTDDEFAAALTVPLYNRLTQRRIVMLLSEVELQLRKPKAEAFELPPKLSIEHVLPQTWTTHWDPVDDDDPAVTTDERDVLRATRAAHVDLLGNLTLVSGKLNPSLSNAPWVEKREKLFKNSVLLLNTHLVGDFPSWDEGAIDTRSQALAARLVEIFPGPTTPVEAWRTLGNIA